MKNIDISAIVPVYNVEEYLPACIESLMAQGDVGLEIILVNDGSTDRSGSIADEYARRDSRIKVINQKNGGASAARNTGLKIAQGEYIVFVDSDDWLKSDSLHKLRHEAVRYQADLVMGSLLYHQPDPFFDRIYRQVPDEIRYIPFSGKEGFVRLAKAKVFISVVWNYLYRRRFIEKIQAQFEEGIMNEDELWCPVVLCQAERMVIVDIAFYYYRIRDSSVMHSTPLERRLDSLFRVTDRLIDFADHSDFSGADGEFKNWWYANILKLYNTSFTILSHIKDTSYSVPERHLDRFGRESRLMIPESQLCDDYFQRAQRGLKKYTDWRLSCWVESIDDQIRKGKKLMLVYNILPDEELTLNREDVPPGWVITTDRHYFEQAAAVVFHLPSLYQLLNNALDKQEGQVWISWYLESEIESAWIEDAKIRKKFDCWMCYQEDDKPQEHPLARLCRKVDAKQFEEEKVFCPC